mmetsp:Transcript_1721/g.3701  ORF Transcript_1721/g.3701 Transcript_1721/m.3701 type:complete len:211 (-) Transcript_1721:241-873(-)
MRFLNPLAIECGTDAAEGTSVASETAAMFDTAAIMCARISSSVMSSTLALKMFPSWKIFSTLRAYENGMSPNFCISATSELPIFSPSFTRCTGLMISIWPLLIFVWMLSTWKNDVNVGSIPVGPAGTVTSHCAKVPALAAAGTLWDSMISRISFRSPTVNTIPTLPTSSGSSCSSSGCLSRICLIAVRIMVFLPITISDTPRISMRSFCS